MLLYKQQNKTKMLFSTSLQKNCFDAIFGQHNADKLSKSKEDKYSIFIYFACLCLNLELVEKFSLFTQICFVISHICLHTLLLQNSFSSTGDTWLLLCINKSANICCKGIE